MIFSEEVHNIWKNKTVDLPSKTDYVAFEGIRGGKSDEDPHGDMAIDDITFKACSVITTTSTISDTTTLMSQVSELSISDTAMLMSQASELSMPEPTAASDGQNGNQEISSGR